jgi:hypothetical protein
MAPESVRLTRRGWIALGVVGALLLIGGLTIVLVSRSGTPDCTVRVGDRTVDLDRDEAEKASSAVALVVRRTTGAAAAADAVDRAVDLSSDDAEAVAAALTGQATAALSCTYGGSSTAEPDELDAHGLTARAEAVREDVLARFGQLPLGGYAPGGVKTGHMPGSAHYEGRAIDAFFRPVSARNKTQGWALAQYLVANAERLSIDTVIFDDQIWTARRAEEGWRDYRVDVKGMTPTVKRVLEHRDHVHVDVAD